MILKELLYSASTIILLSCTHQAKDWSGLVMYVQSVELKPTLNLSHTCTPIHDPELIIDCLQYVYIQVNEKSFDSKEGI